MSEPFLMVRNLRVAFGRGTVQALRGVSFDLCEGRTLCLVGESGSGKSVTASAIMGLHPPGTQVVADRLELGGERLLEGAARDRRGRKMAMIFQDPMTSLNPALTIGFQLREALVLHERVSRRAADARVLDVMRQVRIPDPELRLRAYPHQLSGGMRQRVMIAMALVCRPRLLIADEPTTALDVTVQAQILWLLQELQREFGTAILFITHDLGVVSEIAHEVAVMYAGRIVEQGPVIEVFDRPAHGYTVGLLGATLDFRTIGEGGPGRLTEIPGHVPRPDELGAGCAFVARCGFADATCAADMPAWHSYGADHGAACGRVRSGNGAVRPEPARRPAS